MKKILMIVLSSLLAFNVVFLQPVNEADAFVSKLMSLAAKKMVKNVTKEIAVDSAVNFALNQAFEIAQAEMDKYNQREAYKIVCLKAMTGEVCDKPISIKENLTEADKIAIGHQAEIELDKLVSVDGKGFSRWQKFLDWFAPIWISSAILTVITYAVDSDVRSLFNEAGYNALVALGLIQPVTTKENSTVTEQQDQLPPRTVDTGSQDTTLDTYPKSYTNTNVNQALVMNIPFQNLVIKTDLTARTDMSRNTLNVNSTHSSMVLYQLGISSLSIGTGLYTDIPASYQTTFAINGQVQGTVNGGYSSYTTNFNYPASVSIEYKKMQSVMYRTPYQVGGFWYTDILFNTTDGNVVTMQIKSAKNVLPANLTSINNVAYYDIQHTATIRTTIYKNQIPLKQIIPADYSKEDVQLDEDTVYEKDGNIALVPPVAIPMTQTSTGKKVTVQPNPTPGGEPVATNEDGEIVQDEDITVSDPVITPSPDGTPQVTPEPTASNPAPEPQPLIPTAPPPAPPTTPPSPPPEDGGGGKPNIPLSLLIGLFKLLFAIIFYLIRMFTFIVTIQFIQPIPIPNPYFIWFTTAEILGVQPYPLIKNIALFFLSFSIYKSIRRVFG